MGDLKDQACRGLISRQVSSIHAPTVDAGGLFAHAEAKSCPMTEDVMGLVRLTCVGCFLAVR